MHPLLLLFGIQLAPELGKYRFPAVVLSIHL